MENQINIICKNEQVDHIQKNLKRFFSRDLEFRVRDLKEDVLAPKCNLQRVTFSTTAEENERLSKSGLISSFLSTKENI